MKKIISVILVLSMLLGTMSACSNSVKKDYMLKGEFFSLVMSEMNYYPIDNSIEEMENANNYDIEAKSMVDWELFPEEAAYKDLLKPVTKETVLVVLINSMFFAKTGNIDNVKDAKLSDFPQEIANAVETGIIELDKDGCANVKQKLTYDECKELIYKTNEIEANSHFEDDGIIGYDFGDNSVVISPEDIMEDPYFEVIKNDDLYEEETAENILAESSDNPQISFLNIENNGIQTKQLAQLAPSAGQIKVSKDTYLFLMKSPKLGDVVVYDPFLMNMSAIVPAKAQTPIAGKIANILESPYYVTLFLDHIDDKEIMANTEVEKANIKQNSKKNDMQLLNSNGKEVKGDSVEIAGFKISLDYDSSTKMYTISAKKTLKISEDTYGNWRDAEENHDLEISASIGNFQADFHNVKYLFKDNRGNGKSLAKITFDTQQNAKMSVKALAAPDDNRNAGFFTNLAKSRFNNSGKGAKAIKIGKIKIPLGKTGINISVTAYLRITIEGFVQITFDQQRGFELLKDKKGNIYLKPLNINKNTMEIEATAIVALGADISINFTLVKNILVYNIEGYARVSTNGKFYVDGELECAASSAAMPDKYSDALDLSVFDSLYELKPTSYGYSIDIYLYLGLNAKFPEKTMIGGYKNLLYKYIPKDVRAKLSYNLDGSKDILMWEKHFSKNCTQTDEKGTANGDKLLLDNAKVHVYNGCCCLNDITYIPNAATEALHSNNIYVRVKDKNIVSAKIEESNSGFSVMITTNNVGSTEVEVYYKANKASEEMYLQTFSVTVEDFESEMNDLYEYENIAVFNNSIISNPIPHSL